MTNDDEEKMIHDQLISARKAVADLKSEASALRFKQNAAEKYLADIEQAAIDYMTGNGLLESECLRLKKTYVVDVAGEYPDEYARIKTTREPDKRKISEQRPAANWYTIKENLHIQLRSE